MKGTYDIILGGEAIGKAQVKREGLYYRFDCRCRLSGEVMYKLTVCCSEKTENLGIPAPENGEFRLVTRVPIKRLGEGEPFFRAVPRHAKMTEEFIPISPEEPFRYLARLNDATFAIRGGQPGILLSNHKG